MRYREKRNVAHEPPYLCLTVCLSNDVPIETLSKMLGHRSIRTTQIYAKITAEKVSRDMEKLAQRIEQMESFICQAI